MHFAAQSHVGVFAVIILLVMFAIIISCTLGKRYFRKEIHILEFLKKYGKNRKVFLHQVSYSLNFKNAYLTKDTQYFHFVVFGDWFKSLSGNFFKRTFQFLEYNIHF